MAAPAFAGAFSWQLVVAELLEGAVVEPLIVGMALGPNQGLGIDLLLMVQIGLSAALLQPAGDPSSGLLTLADPGDVVGLIQTSRWSEVDHLLLSLLSHTNIL